MRPIRFLEKLLIRFYPVQKIIAILAITSHKSGLFLRLLASLFDQDSSYNMRLISYAKRLENTRDGWLHMSRSPVEMSFDFELRRQLFVLLHVVFRLLVRLFKLLRYLSKLLTAKKETPYDFWQKSLTKSEINCVLDLGGEEFQTIGEFRLDLEAPCDVLQIYTCYFSSVIFFVARDR